MAVQSKSHGRPRKGRDSAVSLGPGGGIERAADPPPKARGPTRCVARDALALFKLEGPGLAALTRPVIGSPWGASTSGSVDAVQREL